jgi:hypothetical protein
MSNGEIKKIKNKVIATEKIRTSFAKIKIEKTNKNVELKAKIEKKNSN